MTEYSGGCQCGAVRYTVDLNLDHPVICNCSRCQRLGSVLAFAPQSAFHLTTGDGATTEYRFNRMAIGHRFCSTCGIQTHSFADGPDGTPMVAVNINCLDGIDPRKIAENAQVYDGRAH